jgi:hypothetical protein
MNIPAQTTVKLTGMGSASGVYMPDAECNGVGPGGSDPNNADALVPTLNNCAAIGKIGDGEPFLIGDAQTANSGEGGNLQLACNDSLATDNQGGFFGNVAF